MNYCTNCGAARLAGHFCGECGHRHPALPVLLDDREDDELDEDGGHPSGGGGWLVGALIVLGLLVVIGYGASKPDIDEASPAFAEGRSVAAAHIAAGAAVVEDTTAEELCSVDLEGGASEAVETAAVNREAGCRTALEEHLAPPR